MPVTNVRPLNQLLGLNGKSAGVIRGYRFGTRPAYRGIGKTETIDYFNIPALRAASPAGIRYNCITVGPTSCIF